MRKEEQHQQKRLDILQGFSELIADHGLENVSIAKLAKHLSIPASLIFYYFKNKEELVDEAVDYVLSVCKEKSIQSIKENENADGEIEFADFLEELFLNYESADEVSHLRAYYVCYNLALRDSAAREKFYRHQTELKSVFQERLDYFVKYKGIPISDSGEAAEILFCLVSGLGTAVDFLDDEKKKEKISRQNLQLFLTYLGLKPQEFK